MSTKPEPTTEPTLELTPEEIEGAPLTEELPGGGVEELMVKGLKISGLEAKYNSAGEAICRLCGSASKDLTAHIKKEYDLIPKEYETRFPGFPLLGLAGKGGVGTLAYAEREKKLYSVKDTFGFE